MPQIENKITIGQISVIVTLAITVASVGVVWGDTQRRIAAVETAQRQFIEDSRTLIRLQSDVEYIRRSVDTLLTQ